MQRIYSLAFLSASLSPPEMIDLAARTGYAYAGIRLLPAAPGTLAHPLMDDPAMLRETLVRLADSPVKIFDLELIRIADDFQVERFLPFFEVGAKLGAKAILVAADDNDRGRLTENYARLCEAAHPFGLSADLEFMPWTAVPSLDDALDLLSNIDQPNAGLLLDALHFARSGSKLEDIARIPRQWLHYAQICDGPSQPADTQALIQTARAERLLPGEGEIDLAAIWERLPQDLPVSVEIPHLKRMAEMGVERWAIAAREASQRTLERVVGQGVDQ